jgi:hypothetical protein
MAADDLAAADAVGVGQYNVKGFDFRMRIKEGTGFFWRGAGRGYHDFQVFQAVSSRVTAAKLSIR